MLSKKLQKQWNEAKNGSLKSDGLVFLPWKFLLSRLGMMVSSETDGTNGTLVPKTNFLLRTVRTGERRWLDVDVEAGYALVKGNVAS